MLFIHHLLENFLHFQESSAMCEDAVQAYQFHRTHKAAPVFSEFELPPLRDQSRRARNDFIASLHGLIFVYCNCTLSSYKLPPLRPVVKQKKGILHCKEKLKVMVNFVHNLVGNWMRDYTEFFVAVNVYYGTQLLAGHNKCISKTVKHDAFFPYIPMNVYMYCVHVRGRRKLCLFFLAILPCPMRARMEDDNTRRPLAFASLPLFDHEMLLRQGQVFIPLSVLKELVLKPWGPNPLTANEKDPVLIVTLPSYEYQVVFSDVAIEYQSIKQDLSSLDSETRGYLMSLVKAGDPQTLKPDELELLWQKRSYLMHLPEALPLVLSSVTDWGYYFLSNVYQILEDWAPLSPVQAMQLLLPQYRDMRLGQKAIEWILCASSDFLFNALPQLSAESRFKCFRFALFS